jgi:hypothetical protein
VNKYLTMAQLNTTTITIKISQLLRDDAVAHELLDEDSIQQLEAVVAELARADQPVLVEICQQ